MRHFRARDYSTLFAELVKFYWLAVKRDDPTTEIADGVVGYLEQLVQKGASLTEELELKGSHNRIVNHLRLEVTGAYGQPQWGRLKDQIGTLLETLQFEVTDRRFAAVAVSKSAFLEGILTEKATPFSPAKRQDAIWLRVWKSFPSVREECEEAVFCYVLERNTACVFHCMRVAEIGLRALARRMKIALPKKRKVEWAEWQQILNGMNDRIVDLGRTLKAGPTKDTLLEFYSGAVAQFTGFKDEFRNQVMHVRQSYDEHQAASALTRVRDFMHKLASEIDERGKRAQGS